MVPTSTGAAKAIGLVLPVLKGKLDGIAIRVPTPNVSVVDLTAAVERDADESSVNAAMKKASEANCRASSRIATSRWSRSTSTAIPLLDFRRAAHQGAGQRLVKIFSWYDNEWGYSNRLADVTAFVASKI